MQTGEQVFPIRNCKGCRARVVWGTVDPELKSGGPVAFDADPDPVKGDHILARDPRLPRAEGKPIVVRATKMRQGQLHGARAAGWSTYRRHDSWCPRAAELKAQHAATHAKKAGRR